MIQTAQTLRLVRQARLAFLWNWTRGQNDTEAVAPRLTDLVPHDDEKRDWRHLYDGSVLDD